MIVERTAATRPIVDQRQYDRLEKNLRVRYAKLEHLAHGEPDLEGELLDIGAGGLCLQADEALPINTQLAIVLEFPGWLADGDQWIATKNWDDVGVLQVVGMVVWVAVSETAPDKFHLGVSFSGVIR